MRTVTPFAMHAKVMSDDNATAHVMDPHSTFMPRGITSSTSIVVERPGKLFVDG
jgi:hypothetical protein